MVEAVVAKRFEVVAAVVVLLVMLLKMLAPAKVLLSPRREDEATPEMVPQTTLPFTTLRAEEVEHGPDARKRLVVEAVLVKKLVVVALVVVEVPMVNPPTKVVEAAVQTLLLERLRAQLETEAEPS